MGNKKFGKINLVKDNSLSETIFSLIEDINKESAACLLAGLMLYTENFKRGLTADIFEIASQLMKQGANINQITENILETIII